MENTNLTDPAALELDWVSVTKLPHVARLIHRPKDLIQLNT